MSNFAEIIADVWSALRRQRERQPPASFLDGYGELASAMEAVWRAGAAGDAIAFRRSAVELAATSLRHAADVRAREQA